MSPPASTAVTGAQFDALPYEEGRRWELLGGELFPVSGPTPEHQLILQRILLAFMLHLDSNPAQGLAFTDVEFALAEHHRVRPDVLVLLRESARRLDMNKVPVPGCPDLAVEVISSGEHSSQTQAKLQAYLRHGTAEVWQVYPKLKSVIVHTGATSATFSVGDRIVTPLLPGFHLDVEAIFAGVAASI